MAEPVDELTASGEEVLFRTRPWLFLLTAAAPYAVLFVVTLVLLPGQGWTSVIVVAAVLLGGTVKIGSRIIELRQLRQPWTIRIGTDGITQRPWQVHISWGQVAEIRVKGRRTIWSWLILGGVKIVTKAELDFSRRAKSKPMGTVIDTRYLDGDDEDVLAAIRRFTDLPVVRR